MAPASRFEKLLAAIILVAGAAIRLIGLEDNPPGLWQDEASTGLDAYLLWTTGRDRAGVFLPLIAQSFGDYPLALYRYLSAPIVGLFGLSIATERAVAAISGSLMIGALGLVLYRHVGARAALFSMIAGAISPQWVHFSRYGSEAILMPFTLVSGWALIAWGTGPSSERRRPLIWLGAISLGLSAYTYHAIKIYLPFWILGFLWLYRGEILALWRAERRHVVGPALLFALIVLPSAVLAFSNEGQARGKTVLAWYHASGLELVRLIVSNYLSYFHMGLLFTHGGPHVAQSIPRVGLWSLIELPLMIVAFVAVARGRYARLGVFAAFWLALGPMPGGLTYESHNVGRAIGWLPAPHILSGLGMLYLLEQVRASGARVVRVAVPTLLGLGWALSASWLVWLVFELYPRITQRDFQFEVSGALRCAERRYQPGMKVVASPYFAASEMFTRFYFEDTPKDAEGRPSWRLGELDTVPSGTLYVFPASRPKPAGRELCAVVSRATGETVSFVYGASPPAPPPGMKLDLPIQKKEE